LQKGIEYLELPEGYRMEALDVPARFVGQTMEQAQLRARHGLNVIAVQSIDPGGNPRRYPPSPSYRLRASDQLIAVASSEDIEAFAKRQENP
jgi:Trk K+ transport system NAD-binding subunit